MDITNKENNTHQGKETRNYTRNGSRIKPVTFVANQDI